MMTIQYIGKQYERPPLVRVELDVTLHNAGDVPRWFLLPTHAGAAAPFRISELSLWRLTNDAGESLHISRLRGTHGCFVILLAPGAAVTLRGLPIRWRGTLPQQLVLTAYAADDVLLDDESLITWFEDVPINAHNMDIEVRTLAEDTHVTYAKHTPDLSEKTVVLVHPQTISLACDLAVS